MKKSCAAVSLVAVAGSVSADVVVPAAYTNAHGTAGQNTLVREWAHQRTFQALIDPDHLAGVGTITGLAFRLRSSTANATNWPAAPITWPSYEVTLSTSPHAAAAMDPWFLSNIGVDQAVVRSGPLTIPANAFTGGGAVGGAPNPFFLLIPFHTAFNYNGGTLCITVRHTGNNAAEGDVRFLDAVPSNGAAGYACFTAAGVLPTTGAPSLFNIVSIVPAPSSMAFVWFGGLFAARRRR